jgi:uncharacterized protein YjbI with pentapeptide repeats
MREVYSLMMDESLFVRRSFSLSQRAGEMANLEHFRVLKQGAKQWNLWHHNNPTEIPDLSEADLRGIDLRQINLEGAVFAVLRLGQSIRSHWLDRDDAR